MRKLLLATIMLGVMLWAVDIQMVGPVPWWVMDNTSSQVNHNYRGICVITDELAWVVGEDGRVWQRTGDDVHTHQWVSVTIDPINYYRYHLNDVCFVDAVNGWIVGEWKADYQTHKKYEGIVYWTDNGGTNWHLPTSLPSFNIPTPFLKVKMANAVVGYISCGNGIVLKTEDGGTNWSRTISDPWNDPKNIELWYNGLWVEPGNPDHLWVSGDAFALVSKSTNGGQTWVPDQPSAFSQTYTFPQIPGTPYGTKLANFNMVCGNMNEVAMALSYGKIGHTSDGGTNWSTTTCEPKSTWFYGIHRTASLNYFASGTFGAIDNTQTASQENINFRWYPDNAVSRLLSIDGATSNFVYAAGSGIGSIRQRYVPASYVEVICPSPYWNSQQQRYEITISCNVASPDNIRDWVCSQWVHNHIFRFWTTQGQSIPYWTFYLPYYSPKTDYYYEIVLHTWDLAYPSNNPYSQEIAVVRIPATDLPNLEGIYTPPGPPTGITAYDVLSDNGGRIEVTVSGTPGYSYFLARSRSSGGPFYYIAPVTLGDPYIDNTVQNDADYYYAAIAVGSSHNASDMVTTMAACQAKDNSPPDKPLNFVGEFIAGLDLVKLTWALPAVNKDIAGYWVCPVFPDGLRYRLAHSSPITRSIYYIPVDPGFPGGEFSVAAMDTSGQISEWQSIWVTMLPNLMIGNNPSASGLNNSPKLVFDLSRNSLHAVFSNDNDILYKNSADEGLTWGSVANLGRGFFPSLVKNNDGEFHCAWVNREPEMPPYNPIDPEEHYIPGMYSWELKYSQTTQGVWGAATVLMSYVQPYSDWSMKYSAPCITTTADDSVHIFFERTSYEYYPVGWEWRWELVFGKFHKHNPAGVVWAVIDSIVAIGFPPPPPWPGELGEIADPSCVVDRYGNLHVVYAVASQIRYLERKNGDWSTLMVISPSAGVYDQPCIGINRDEITVVWSGNPMPAPGSQIFTRRRFLNSTYWGNAERIDKTDNLSIFPICLINQILWTEQVSATDFEIYYSRLNGYRWTEPENLSKTPYRSVFAQAAYRCEPHKSTLYYIFTDGNTAPYFLFSSKKVFVTEEIPVYASDLGAEQPSSATVERDGFLVYGDEPYQTVDYDSTALIYELTGFDPQGKYEIEWDWYHESNENWHQRLRIEGIFNEHKWVPSGEQVTIRKPVPQAVVQDGMMEITNEVTSPNGLAILSGFAVFEITGHGGGPQGSEAKMPARFLLEPIYPNPTNKVMKIRFNSPDERQVSIKLYDVTGRLVIKLFDGKAHAGMNEVSIIAGELANGIYFAKLEADKYSKVEKVILLR